MILWRISRFGVALCDAAAARLFAPVHISLLHQQICPLSLSPPPSAGKQFFPPHNGLLGDTFDLLTRAKHPHHDDGGEISGGKGVRGKGENHISSFFPFAGRISFLALIRSRDSNNLTVLLQFAWPSSFSPPASLLFFSKWVREIARGISKKPPTPCSS